MRSPVLLLVTLLVTLMYSCTPADLREKPGDSDELLETKRNLLEIKDYAVTWVDDHKNTPLHMVTDREAVALLISHGGDLTLQNDRGLTPLAVAVWENRLDAAEMMLRKGADPNQPVKYGNSLLHNASYAGNAQMLELLIKHGALMNSRGGGNMSPLHDAKNADVARVLIRYGANINARDDSGKTPLHESKDLELTKVLLEAGADVNIADEKGYTPLHSATLYNKPDIVGLLIENGADVNAKAENGRTPLSFVQGKANWSAVIDILKEHGATAK